MVIRRRRQGQLRIIGGQWRGRKLDFPPTPDLRPTLDSVRETLFNWLQAQIPGARCLDLFAGSGAIGLEALSRGAADVIMVEQERSAATQIQHHLQTLDCETGKVNNSNVFDFLTRPATQFDIVFLDPPYQLNCLEKCCQLLEQHGWLKDGAYIYLEGSTQLPSPRLPENWQRLRSKKTSTISYHLAQRN